MDTEMMRPWRDVRILDSDIRALNAPREWKRQIQAKRWMLQARGIPWAFPSREARGRMTEPTTEAMRLAGVSL